MTTPNAHCIGVWRPTGKSHEPFIPDLAGEQSRTVAASRKLPTFIGLREGRSNQASTNHTAFKMTSTLHPPGDYGVDARHGADEALHFENMQASG